MTVLAGKTIVLGVTGGIAAYKAAELCRALIKEGASVRVVMTRAAQQFITPLTLQTLSGHPVGIDLFDLGREAPDSGIGHIQLADEADLVVVAPATADSIARFAAGMADDLLAAVLLATRAPVLLAPAMNVNMWENPLTQENLARLVRTGRVTTVGPDRGELACGWIGAGRLIEPDQIVAAVIAALSAVRVTQTHAEPLAGRAVVVTAGPTHEAIDDVRFLGNRSSGKMGFALAAEAAALGAQVTLIAGPVALATPPGTITRVDVESAAQLRDALSAVAGSTDVVVMAAAVADFRPAAKAKGKLSRRAPTTQAGGLPGAPDLAQVASGDRVLDLVANPDLLAELGRRQPRPMLVGFAAEHDVAPAELVTRARAKLREKGCDAVVANDVSVAGLGFGSDRNAVTVVTADREIVLGPTTKRELAARIWAELLPLLSRREASPRAAVRKSAGG